MMTGAILAGGESKRIGLNKALMEVGGIPIIERALKVLQGLFDEVFIVATRTEAYAHLGCPVHTDLLPGNDSLGGIHAALSYASHEICFIGACDMPFLNPRLIRYLAELAHDAEAVVPKNSDGLQPLHAVYTKRCLPAIEASIASGQLKLADLISRLNARVVEGTRLADLDPDGRSFFNINRVDDLKEAHLLARTFDNAGDTPHGKGRNS